MSLLSVDAGATAVTALVVADDGRVVARGRADLVRHGPQPGWVEHSPDDLWRATLEATRAAVTQVDRTSLQGLGVVARRGGVVLWDRDTLGSPRPVIAGGDRRTTATCERLRGAGHDDRVAELTGSRIDSSASAPALLWLSEHEPHTWALVEAGRYAVGTVDSYLVARMTRGLEHLTDVSQASRTLLLDRATGGWSDELCGLFGVPGDALPELVPSWGEVAVTEPRTFLDLALPVTGVAGDRQAVHLALAGSADDGASCTDASVLLTTGAVPVRPGAGLRGTAAWRSPDGAPTHAVEVDLQEGPEPLSAAVDSALEALPVTVARLRVAGDAFDDEACRLLADRAGVEVERSPHADAAALGAAYLAGLGTGTWASPDALRDLWRPDRTFAPAGWGGAGLSQDR